MIAAAQTAVKVAYIHSFRLVFLVAIAFGAVAICCALMSRNVDPKNKHSKRAVTMENEKDVKGIAEKASE